MISIILSIGAINAFIPLIIILILIVAAAGLMRGYNIFALFGIGVLLGGAGKATLARKNVASKTAGVRAGLKTGQKAQALGTYIRKEAIPKARKFAKYYRQEYKASRALGVSRAEAAKIASANARINMIDDRINTSQSSLDNIDSKLGGSLKKSSALKNDIKAQNLYNSINSERARLSDLRDQANRIRQQPNRTSAAAAKANLNKMKQIQREYRETANNYVKDLYRFKRRFIVKGTMGVVSYYSSKAVNLVLPNKLKLNVPKPSFLQNTNELEEEQKINVPKPSFLQNTDELEEEEKKKQEDEEQKKKQEEEKKKQEDEEQKKKQEEEKKKQEDEEQKKKQEEEKKKQEDEEQKKKQEEEKKKQEDEEQKKKQEYGYGLGL